MRAHRVWPWATGRTDVYKSDGIDVPRGVVGKQDKLIRGETWPSLPDFLAGARPDDRYKVEPKYMDGNTG